MEFLTKYKELHQKVEQRINEKIPALKPESIYSPFRYIMESGGKRIRPVLTMLCCGAAGGDPMAALDPALGIEVMHNFTLVHDDIMDQSPMRRGRATIHTKWGEPTAILTGDLMIGYAFSFLPCDLNYKRNGKVLKAFTKALIEVCEGQALDMEFNNDKNVKIDDYINMINKKTGKLLETCAIIGGAMAEADDDTIENLRKFASYTGIAFQIQDDLLDMIADEDKLGKKIGKDIEEGKKTYLILHAKDNLQNSKQKALLDEFYEKDGLPTEKVIEMKNLFEETGAFSKAVEESDKYFDCASNILMNLPQNEYVIYLEQLINSLKKRNF